MQLAQYNARNMTDSTVLCVGTTVQQDELRNDRDCIAHVSGMNIPLLVRVARDPLFVCVLRR